MQWVASTLHTTSEHGVSNITTADARTSAASSRLNWRPLPADLNGLVRFARKTKCGFCAWEITFQLASTTHPANTRTVHSLTTAVRNNRCFQSVYCRINLCGPYQQHSTSPPQRARHAHPISPPPATVRDDFVLCGLSTYVGEFVSRDPTDPSGPSPVFTEASRSHSKVGRTPLDE